MSKTAGAVKADKEVPHYAGHRQRLRERFLKSGAGALTDYKLLEIILYGASPRIDTKPLAKKLLNHFGRFAAVIHATAVELGQVEGMGEAAIVAIKSIIAASTWGIKRLKNSMCFSLTTKTG